MQVKGVCVFEQLEFVIILRHQCEFVQIIDWSAAENTKQNSQRDCDYLHWTDVN